MMSSRRPLRQTIRRALAAFAEAEGAVVKPIFGHSFDKLAGKAECSLNLSLNIYIAQIYESVMPPHCDSAVFANLELGDQ
jgi:hypothetical protein